MVMNRHEASKVTLFRRPFATLYYLGVVLCRLFVSSLSKIFQHWILSSLVATLLTCTYVLLNTKEEDIQYPILHEVRAFLQYDMAFALYWITLGVLSSIGLGSGLHTFVLFLGPHIAKVASTAVSLGSADFSAEMKQFFRFPVDFSVSSITKAFQPVYAPDAWNPVTVPEEPLTLFDVMSKVALACFYWGLGTALGELPPYFVAKAARRAGQALDEIAELVPEFGADGESSEDAGSNSLFANLMKKAKDSVFHYVHTYGFWAILLAASIPNPLFDLAGLTCGHFGIPFVTFFGATFIGKAIIKVGIQSAALISIIFATVSLFDHVDTLRLYLAGAIGPGAIGSLVNKVLQNMQVSIAKHWHGKCLSLVQSPPFDLESCHSCCLNQPQHASLCRNACDLAQVDPERISQSQAVGTQESSLISSIWGSILFIFIAWFITTIIDSLVQEYLMTQVVESQKALQEASSRSSKAATPGKRVSTPKRSEVRSPQVPSSSVASPLREMKAANASLSEVRAIPGIDAISSSASSATSPSEPEGELETSASKREAASFSPVRNRPMRRGSVAGNEAELVAKLATPERHQPIRASTRSSEKPKVPNESPAKPKEPKSDKSSEKSSAADKKVSTSPSVHSSVRSSALKDSKKKKKKSAENAEKSEEPVSAPRSSKRNSEASSASSPQVRRRRGSVAGPSIRPPSTAAYESDDELP